MATARFLSPSAEDSVSIYHCVSRVVNRDFILGREEKAVFVRLMRQYEAFCGVRVLSYCVMSDHFHILVEVPPKKAGEPVAMSDGEFLERVKGLYSKVYFRDVEEMLTRFRRDGHDKAAEGLKAEYTHRMHELSFFMQGVKQRFSSWYNRTHGRRGTLWEGRFKSVLVQDGYAARVMAAYIDLNPVRAGMVEKPEDYRWCSYGEAMQAKATRGRKLAREGVCRVLQGADDSDQRRDTKGASLSLRWENGAAERYRMMLFADGEEVFVDERETGEESRRVRKGFRRKDVEKVLARGGKLSFGEALRCRVRYFTDGMTFGSRKFVDEVFEAARERFGEKRKDGARSLRGVGWRKKQARLYSMRQLVKDRIG